MQTMSEADMEAQEAAYERHERALAAKAGMSHEDYCRAEAEHYQEEEREEAARVAAGGRTVCEKCGQRSVVHRSVCTLGFPGHPGAEFSDYGQCEGPRCRHVEF